MASYRWLKGVGLKVVVYPVLVEYIIKHMVLMLCLFMYKRILYTLHCFMYMYIQYEAGQVSSMYVFVIKMYYDIELEDLLIF